MPRGRKRGKRSGAKRSERASISFPADVYETLEQLAMQKKVSLAWVVREAVDNYITDKWPLFARDKQ